MNQSNIGLKINSQIKDFNKKKTDELKIMFTKSEHTIKKLIRFSNNLLIFIFA